MSDHRRDQEDLAIPAPRRLSARIVNTAAAKVVGGNGGAAWRRVTKNNHAALIPLYHLIREATIIEEGAAI